MTEAAMFEQLVDRHQLSPIQKIPVEILREIFILVHSDAVEVVGYHTNSFPRIATQVSLLWRLAAYSCPPLWCNIHLCFKFSQELSESSIYETRQFIEDCILRSREEPLKLIVAEKCAPALLGDACLHALGKSAYRWKDLEIHENTIHEALFASIPVGTSLKQLESLHLYKPQGPIDLTAPNLIRLCMIGGKKPITLRFSSSLRDVILRWSRFPLRVLGDLPWVTVTSFEASEIYYAPDELSTLLKSAPNLVSLKLDGTTEGSTRIITLPKLQTLHIRATGTTLREGTALDIIRAPNLKSLHLTWEVSSDSLEQFFQRSAPHLDHLSLSRTFFSLYWLTIPEASNIKSLHWDYPIGFYLGISLLTNRSESMLFPCLDRLEIEHAEFDNLSGDRNVVTIIEMLKSRLPHQEEEPSWGFLRYARTTAFGMMKSRLLAQPEKEAVSPSGSYLKYARISFSDSLSERDAEIFSDFIQSSLVRNSGMELIVMDSSGLNMNSIAH